LKPIDKRSQSGGIDVAASATAAPSAKSIRRINPHLEKSLRRFLAGGNGFNYENNIVAVKGGVVRLAGSMPECLSTAFVIVARFWGVKVKKRGVCFGGTNGLGSDVSLHVRMARLE